MREAKTRATGTEEPVAKQGTWAGVGGNVRSVRAAPPNWRKKDAPEFRKKQGPRSSEDSTGTYATLGGTGENDG